MTDQTTQPDPQAMAAIMAKIAKVQKILGILTYGQVILGALFLLAPFLPDILGMKAFSYSFMLLAPYLFGLAYGADFAKKDLTFARVVFRNTAIAQLGLFVIALYGWLIFQASILLILAIIALILGGLPAMVIYQALKEQK